ncbi:hypothetical protein KCP69_07555 [Salmonella enterica subsp. enterica]|nr:hypothetical protein KCP69_07555 [Salmonella enterica subsp. enterica]
MRTEHNRIPARQMPSLYALLAGDDRRGTPSEDFCRAATVKPHTRLPVLAAITSETEAILDSWCVCVPVNISFVLFPETDTAGTTRL